jgi:hypothetical protein
MPSRSRQGGRASSRWRARQRPSSSMPTADEILPTGGASRRREARAVHGSAAAASWRGPRGRRRRGRLPCSKRCRWTWRGDPAAARRRRVVWTPAGRSRAAAGRGSAPGLDQAIRALRAAVGGGPSHPVRCKSPGRGLRCAPDVEAVRRRRPRARRRRRGRRQLGRRSEAFPGRRQARFGSIRRRQRGVLQRLGARVAVGRFLLVSLSTVSRAVAGRVRAPARRALARRAPRRRADWRFSGRRAGGLDRPRPQTGVVHRTRPGAAPERQ